MAARVTNLAGGIVAEKRSGSRRFHRHDPLGSTIALVDDSGVTTDTYSYWPYGEERATTGIRTNPWENLVPEHRKVDFGTLEFPEDLDEMEQ